MRGTINNISIAGMIRLLINFKKTGVFHIESNIVNGNIEIYQGNIVDVIGPRVDKRESLVVLLTNIKEGIFYFEEKQISKKEPLDLCIEDIILESARNLYENFKDTNIINDFLLPENEVLKISSINKGKVLKIKIYDDEWNLLIRFTGNNNIINAINESGIEKNKADFILYGLLSAGLIKRTRFKIPEISKILREELGNIGVAIVDSSFIKLKMDRMNLGMREFLSLLNEIENSVAEITGKTRAKAIIEKIWEATK